MSDQANRLREGVHKRKQYLIGQLIEMGFYKTYEGKQLYELTLSELEKLHIDEKCRIGKEMDRLERDE